MIFKIEDGLDIISIRASEIGSYFNYGKPVTVDWYDANDVRSVCMLPTDPDYRNEVRSRLTDRLNEDYKERPEELKGLLDPLLKLFRPGEYTLNYYRAEDYFRYYRYVTADHREEYKSTWDLVFSPIVDIREKELKIKEHQQYLTDEINKKNPYPLYLIEYTTGMYFGAGGKTFVATLPEAEIDQERVKYFENKITNGARPFVLVFDCYFQQLDDEGGDISLDTPYYIIDGHHRLLAYKKLKIDPPVVEIRFRPGSREDVEFDVETLIDMLFPWQVKEILDNWDNKEKYILKYLKNPDSKVHQFTVRHGA